MMEWSEKKDQIEIEVDNNTMDEFFLKLSNDIDIEQIKILLENHQIEVDNIDKVIREIMFTFEKKPEKNCEIIKELFSYADLNYMNSKYNDSNILMNCCEKGEPKLVDLLLNGNNANNNDKKSIEIDLFKVDKNNENILHYLFSRNIFEFDTEEIFEKIMLYATNNIKNNNKIDLLTKEDKNGITPLVIILKKGWFNVLQIYFKYFEYKPHIIKSNKNNYIHCAIEGKNIKCLKSILKHCSFDELNQTNSSGLNPCLYAKEKKYFYMSDLIKQFQNNYNNEEIKKILLLIDNDTNSLVKLFMEKNFSQAQKYLSKYKLNQNINDKYSNISFEWNSLLTKRYDIFNKGLKEEHILTKFTKNSKNSNINPYQNKPNVIAALLEFNKFFNKYTNETAIKEYINEDNYSIDIVMYNKIIYFYKICDYSSFLKYVNLYFAYIYPQIENNFINSILKEEKNDKNKNEINYNKIRINYHKYITFVNISFLLIEYFMKDNNELFSQLIMDELDKYFTDNSPLPINNNKKKEIEKDINEPNILSLENKKIIIQYLNNTEVLHPLNNSLDDSLCYLHLLEVLFIIKFNSSKSEAIRLINKLSNINIKLINDKSEEENEEKDEEDEEEENDIDENNNIYDDIHLDNNKNNIKILNNSQNILKKVKFILKNSNLLQNFRKRFKMFYYELKSYLYYLSGDVNKCIDKTFKIKKLIGLDNKSNEYYCNEHKIFYYNSQGIINLRLKKYSLAEYYFKLGIYLFKTIHNDNNTSNSIDHNDIVINKSEYLFKMKFNLALSYYFNNNYIEAYHIFNEIKDVQLIKNNLFFWFRFGLSSLNLYLYSMRKIKQKKSKFLKNLNKNKEEEENSDINYNEENENNSVDELYEEYEKIYGHHDNLDIYLENKDNKTNKIFLETSKNFGEFDYDKNINNYLDISINAFKKVLNIYKKINNNYLNENKKLEDLKGIFNFYSKNIGESKEFKNMLNKQNITKKNNIPKSLIYSCYLNLLFSYNLKKKYLDMLLLIKNIKKEKNLSSSIKRKIKYYELLSLINLNRNNTAEELINEEMNKYGNINNDTNNDFDCFNIDDFQIEKDINHKIFLDIGQIFIDCKNKKYEEAEKKLLDIIENNYNGNEDISKYYYQLMIYILSSQNKKSKTIKFIKFRWKQIQNNNITHTNIYKDNNG